MSNYSKNFERDWNWYYKYKDIFIFSGSLNRKLKEDFNHGKRAKECFHTFDSQGKLISTNEPICTRYLFCKGGCIGL